MRISRLKPLFTKRIHPNTVDVSHFFQDGEIDYELLQKDLIKTHLEAFKYYELLLKQSLEVGCTKTVEAANKGMILHSQEIAKLSGMTYYAEINAAAARLEREGYTISNDDSE